MANFYKQDKGLIIIPENYSKFNTSWSLDNIIEGFKKFYKDNERYPIHDSDFKSVNYLPNLKTIQRKFGGIIKIRSLLGLSEIDFSKGQERSNIAKKIGERGFVAEEMIYSKLKNIFGEAFVHYQSRVNIRGYGYSVNVDFIIFHAKGKVAIDVFFPESSSRDFSNNTSAKLRTYKNFPFKVVLCVANTFFKTSDIVAYLENKKIRKTSMNENIQILNLEEFYEYIKTLFPLHIAN